MALVATVMPARESTAALLLILLVPGQLAPRRRSAAGTRWQAGAAATVATGAGVGFTTLVASAVGPADGGLPGRRSAVGLGLVHREMLLTTAVLAPLVVLGGRVGRPAGAGDPHVQ